MTVMGRFDYFVGELKCAHCGSTSKGDSQTNMQTKLSTHPQLAELAVGQRLDADWSEIPTAGYLCIKSPLINDSITLLETWACPACDKAFNWARICIENSIIRSVDATALTADVVEATNYISDECRFLLSDESIASSGSIVSSLLEYLGRLADG